MAAFITGQEAGMQRVLLCSYNHTTGTYVCETVARVGNRILEKIKRVNRFRLSLNLPVPPPAEGEEGVNATEPQGPDQRSPISSNIVNSTPRKTTRGDSGFTWRVDSVIILLSLVSGFSPRW